VPGGGARGAGAPRELTATAREDITNSIADGRRDLTDDPERGLASMERLKKDLQEKQKQGYNVSEDLGKVEVLIQDLTQVLKEKGVDVAAGSAPETPAAEKGAGSPKPKPEAAKPEAPKAESPKPAPTKAAGEPSGDDDLPDDLNELEGGGEPKPGGKEN
jgi:membrane protein involved in colicin uptake